MPKSSRVESSTATHKSAWQIFVVALLFDWRHARAMSDRSLALIVGAVTVAAALAYRSRGVLLSTVPIDDESGAFDVGAVVDDAPGINNAINDSWLDEETVVHDNEVATPEQRLAAFLYAIRASEHRFPDDVQNDACYTLFYSRIPFVNISDHPTITGEVQGIKLSDAMCRNAGFAPGCVSTAAGAYQIIKPTWLRARASGTWGPRLMDFSKASQDEAARRILIMSDAYNYVLSGNFERAIEMASTQWASLPKATVEQNPRNWQFVTARYDEGLIGGFA